MGILERERSGNVRTVVLRVVALALLLLLALFSAISIRTLNRLPDTLLYFVRESNTSLELEAVGRRLKSTRIDPTERARLSLEALIEGPTSQESAKGLSTALLPGVRVLGSSLQSGILHLDLSRDFEAGGGSALMQSRLNQVFFTLTQPEDVLGVSLYLEGEPVLIFSQEGLLVDNPWLRAEHPEPPRW